ncbi:TIGR02530 family flagellar biosynthesis protein [Alteribacillus sp. HJP-4]|uniref:TIGR02530 family flagellar biosynthesis protein n=1 Tax=Alteribacillus sp. HJP-4 TaxID=2775394 RepID=UPI0035CD05BA
MTPGIDSHGIHQLPHPGQKTKAVKTSQTTSFQEIFKKQVEQSPPLTVSRHAERRLHNRDVAVTEIEWKKINEKLTMAKEKGVRDSIVLTDKAALVVSAENHTVITAMTKDEAADHIFTNINGTIVVSSDAARPEEGSRRTAD